MRITDLLAGDGYIIINKHLAKDIGLNEAILLGELASEYNYWCDRGELIDGWFYSTIENVEEQTTLSGYQQRMALKHLEDIGLVRVERKGTPAKRYLYLDIKALNNKLLKNLTTRSEKIKEQEVEKLYGNNNKEKIINNNNNKSNREQVPYQRIIDSFNDICTSFPKVKSLSDSRKKAIKARLNTYSVEQIIEAFRKAEASDFLKGKNNRDWQASFDWIMKDANIAKVLDGNYDKKGTKESPKDDPNYELKQQMIALMTGKGV